MRCVLDFRFGFKRGEFVVSGVEKRGFRRDGEGDSDLIFSLGENAKSVMFNRPLKLGGARSASAETPFSSSNSSSFISSILVCSLSGLCDSVKGCRKERGVSSHMQGIATWTLPSQMPFFNRLNDSSLMFSEHLPLEGTQGSMWYRSCS